MSKRNSATASRLDAAIAAIDKNILDAKATVAVTKITERHARNTTAWITAACNMAARAGASEQCIAECLANVAHDRGDIRQHNEILGSLFRERR